MRIFILILLLTSYSAQACLIQFQVKEVIEEEQAKGRLKKTIEIQEDHSIDADSIVRISYDLNSELGRIFFHFKNKTTLDINYNENTLADIKKQFAKCKK